MILTVQMCSMMYHFRLPSPQQRTNNTSRLFTPCGSATRLQRFRAPHLYASTSARLQRASSAPYLHVYTPAASFQHPIPPRLPASDARLELHTSLPPCLQVRIALPDAQAPCLRASTSLHTYNASPEIQSSLCLYVGAPAASLQLHTSTSARVQRASRAPELEISIPPCLHVPTSTARL